MADIVDVNGVKQYLQEMNKDYLGRKTWANLYGQVDMSRQSQLGQLSEDYSEAAAQAYATALANKHDVMASNLGQGFKEIAADNIDVALEEAYNAYRQTYLENAVKVEANATTATDNITTALTQQSQMTTNYINELPGYLQALYDKYGADFFNNETWRRYLVDSGSVDAEGNPIYRVANSDELYNMMVKADENGELQFSDKGFDIFDQLQNINTTQGLDYSFKDYLGDYDNEELGLTAAEKTKRKELVSWLDTVNPYHYDANADGYLTNETFTKIMTDSADNKYSFLERFGGMTEAELNTRLSKFSESEAKITELIKDGAKEGDVLGAVDTYIDDITSYMTEIGIHEDFEANLKKAGYTLDSYKKELKNGISEYYKAVKADKWEEAVKITAAIGTSMAFVGLNIITGGTFSFAVAVGATAAGGLMYGALNEADSHHPNYDGMSLNLATMLTAYAQNKRKSIQNK